ncbi:DUF5658 family protein [Lysinibacillus sphaericus]|uniref:DUF5658 family protein n=1 Tax=Lysinibacillus sphaericus TaxID=1421 RepID=UPI003F78CEC2
MKIRKPNMMSLSLVIAILNIFDGFATHYGLTLNIIEELNPIMKLLWFTSPTLFLLVKIMLSYVISCLSYLVDRRSGERFQKFFFNCLVGLFVIYLGIGGLHMLWLTML